MSAVLITGTSSGLGLETAIAAARAGFATVATMRNLGRSESLRKAAADAGVTLDIRQLDVTDASSISDCIRGVVSTHGRLDALVNNAGRANNFPTIEQCTMDAYRANLEVNFFGVVATTRAAMPHLRASRGRVVTIGSTRGLIAQPFNEAYSAAKFAVEGFLESLAPVAAGLGVTVTIVEPGPVLETSFGANSGITRESLLAASGPYAEVLEPYLDWVVRTAYPGAQTAREVAEVVLHALTEPSPPFRIPTSDWAREYAAIKFADVDGSIVQAMTRSWLTPPPPDGK
jgi:NAD(P)-dependent dehydrogenase (short-subunit alcohol dehydrogenase family)